MGTKIKFEGVFAEERGKWIADYTRTVEGEQRPGYGKGDVVHTGNGVYRSNVSDNTTNPDEDKTGAWSVWANLNPVNNATAQANIASGLAQTFEARLAELEATGTQEAASYCAASWADGELAPEAVSVRGSRSFALAWYPYLVDMAQNTGDTLTHDAAKRLRPNNWLRYEDGSWAPCVCVSAEDWALCDAALYLDAEGTNKYCDAGAFDAAAFYDRYGVDTPLYTADGTEVAHIRRPWETTSKDYSHFVGRKDTVWLCDTQAGDTGVLWRGIFGDKTGFDGTSFSAYKLPPTGISPGPCCTVSNKTRNFFYLFQGDNANCRGSVGDAGFSGFTGGRTYPRVNDAQQVNNMNWARANNAVTTQPYPVAEGGFNALNAFISSMEAAYGTKYLHDPSLFSSGISSNNGCTNEATLLAYGGVRYRKTGTETWSYANFNTDPSFAYNSTGTKNHFSALLNREFPKMQVDEAQVALSYAAERGILPGQEFTLYGGIYWYEDVTGAVTLLSGQMNARLYKRVTGTITGYNSSTVDGATVWQPSEYEVEVILRTGVMSGVNPSGDIFWYFGGGCEAVGECTVNPNTSKVGNPVKMYAQPDQTKWLRVTDISLTSPATFAFERSYILLRETTNDADSYVTAREPYHPYPIKRGGGISTGECYYCLSNNYWGSVGQRVRIALRFRGAANLSFCSPRSLTAHYAASLTTRATGCSAQILLPQG